MAKLRGGTAQLRVRWIGLKGEDRICGQCGLREMENVNHLDEDSKRWLSIYLAEYRITCWKEVQWLPM